MSLWLNGSQWYYKFEWNGKVVNSGVGYATEVDALSAQEERKVRLQNGILGVNKAHIEASKQRRKDALRALARAKLFDQISMEPNTGCWLWEGSEKGNGYGQIRVVNKDISTHRLSYELTYGKIPKGMHVLHACDTPACINPLHLFLGTHQENMEDRKKKKRGGRHIVSLRQEMSNQKP